MIPGAENISTGWNMAGWMTCFLGVCGSAKLMIGLYDRVIAGVKETPPPAATYATIATVDRIEREIKSDIDGLDAGFTKELGRIDGRIDKLELTLAGLDKSIVVNGEKRKDAIELKVQQARNESANEAKEIRKEISDLAVEVGGITATVEDLKTSLGLITLKLESLGRKS